jgi:hypothetical protein
MGHARKERVVLFGTDQRITSGPAAMAAASRRRQSSKRKQAFPLQRGRRPYMTLRVATAADPRGSPPSDRRSSGDPQRSAPCAPVTRLAGKKGGEMGAEFAGVVAGAVDQRGLSARRCPSDTGLGKPSTPQSCRIRPFRSSTGTSSHE